MHDGGGSGTGRLVIEIWSDAAKLTVITDVRVAGLDRADIWSEKEMRLSKMKPRRAEWAVSSEQELILASCCLSPVRRNSVLDELRVLRD